MTAANRNRQLEDATMSLVRMSIDAYEKGDMGTAIAAVRAAGRFAREHHQRTIGVYSEDADTAIHHLRRLQGDTVNAALEHRRRKHPGAAE